MAFVKTEVQGAVEIITIDRPKALNALNPEVLADLKAAFEAVDQETIRCIVLTGEGDKSFVAGADIGSMSTMTKAEGEAFGKLGNDVFLMIESFPIPVIAAVNGFALGGGNELAMSCDIRICSDNAVFGQPEVGLGITPGFGGTQRLARLVGMGMAKQLVYSALNIKADEAYRIGLVNAVYPQAELMENVLKLAGKIAKNAPIAVRNCKKAINNGISLPIEKAVEVEEKLFGACFETQELSKVCGTTGVIVSAHTSLCAAPIYENGTPEQKAKYLPKLCSGEWLGAFGLTEPGAGTDAQGQQTIAKEEDDCWVLNGSKIFITNAGFADVFIVIAVTDHVLDKKGRPTKLCSAFIVERTDPGFSVGKAEDKMGIRGSSTCELIFEDCRIPKDRMLGVRGKGFQLAMATLDGGRIGIASQALGIAEGALEETVAYVKERKQFGRSISAFQNTQFELAEMKARVEAAKYLVYAAALKKQQAMDGAKVRYSVEAAQAKLIAARTASDVTRRCLQLFGGYGYTRDYPIERMMRDAKITEIYEGTSEVQMMVISGALLK